MLQSQLPNFRSLVTYSSLVMTFLSYVRLVISKIAQMDVPSWYLFIFACLIAIWLLIRAIYSTITSKWLSTSLSFLKDSFFLLKHFIETARRLEIFLTSAYIITNILIVLQPFTGLNPKSEISIRAATMSIINLVPLFGGSRLILMAELLGISLRTGIGAHQWFGRVAVAEVLLHTIISLTSSQPFKWTGLVASGVVVIYIL